MRRAGILVLCLFLLVCSSTVVCAVINSIYSDVDNDGDLDFYLEFLVRNNNGGLVRPRFDGIGSVPNVTQGYFVDANNDGFEDLFILRRGLGNYFYTNDRDFTFTNATGSAVGQLLAGAPNSPTGVVFADFDGDSVADAFVNQRILLSSGGSFARFNISNVTNASGLSGLPLVSRASAVDINKDNLSDIVFVLDNGSIRLFLNLNDTNNDGIVEFYDATFDTALYPISNATFIGLGNIEVGLAVNGTLGFFPFSALTPPFAEDEFIDLYVVRNGSNQLLVQLFPELQTPYITSNASAFYIPDFIDMSNGSNVDDGGNGTAAIIADFDNNDLNDILIVNNDNTSRIMLRNGTSWQIDFVNIFNLSFLNSIKVIESADWSGNGILDFAGINDSFALRGELWLAGSLAFLGSNFGAFSSDLYSWPSILFEQWFNVNKDAKLSVQDSLATFELYHDGKGELVIGAGNFSVVPVPINNEMPPVVVRGGGGSNPSPVPIWCVRITYCNNMPYFEQCWTDKQLRDEFVLESNLPNSRYKYVGTSGNMLDLKLIPFDEICEIVPPLPVAEVPAEVEKEKIEEKEGKAPEQEGFGSPFCDSYDSIYVPGIGLVTDGPFDYFTAGVRIAEHGVLVQDDYVQYTGAYVDFRRLDFDFGQRVIYCKDKDILVEKFGSYFFLFDPFEYVPLLTESVKLTRGEPPKKVSREECVCENGVRCAEAVWVELDRVMTDKGVLKFDGGNLNFERGSVIDVCVAEKPMFDFLGIDFMTQLLSGRKAVSVSASRGATGSCTPYDSCSITVPDYYEGRGVPDIDLPEGYVFATSAFNIPACDGKVDANIVVPGELKELKVYKFDSSGYEEVPFRLSDGLTCGGSGWSAVVAESIKHVDLPSDSSLDKVYDGGGRDAIVLVHGLFSSSATFRQLIEELRFTRQPYQVWVYDYASGANSTFDGVVADFARGLESINDDVDSITIFAHSLGGLVSEQALWDLYQQRAGIIGKIDRIIVAGTPHEGSKGLKDLGIVAGFLEKTPLSSFPASEEIIDLAVSGKKIDRVPSVDYIVFAGNRKDILTSRLMADPNDGLVTVSSAQRVGGEALSKAGVDYYEFELSHTALPDAQSTINTLFRIAGKDLSQAWLLKGYSQYISIKDVKVDGFLFIIAGRIDKPGLPISACFLATLILYFAGLVLVLSLFFKPKTLLYYISLVIVVVLIAAAVLLCRSFPYVVVGLLILSYLVKSFISAERLPTYTDLNVRLALIYYDLLKGRDVSKSYAEIKAEFESLPFHEKAERYSDMGLLSDSLAVMPEKNELIGNIEKYVDNAVRSSTNMVVFGKVRKKLGKLAGVSPRIDFLLR